MMTTIIVILLLGLVVVLYRLARNFVELEQRVAQRTRELAESEATMRSLFVAGPDCIVLSDQQGRIIDFNPAAEKTFACPRAEALGKDMGELLFPAGQRECLAQFLASGKDSMPGKRMEIRARPASGSEFPAELTLTSTLQGERPLFTVYLRNISERNERKQAEEKLFQKSSELQAVIRAFPDLYYRVDGNGTILSYSAGRTSGYYATPCQGKRLQDMVPVQVRDKVTEAIAQLMETDAAAIFDYSSPRANGEDISFEARLLPLGKHEIIAIVRDITDRKRAEQRLAVQLTATCLLSEASSLAEAAPKLLETVCAGLGWKVGAFWNVDRSAAVLHCDAFYQQPSVEAEELAKASRQLIFAAGRGLPGRVWSSREPVWIGNILGEADFPRAQLAAEAGLKAAFAFPILENSTASGGAVLGVLEFFNSCQAPNRDLNLLMSTICNQISQFIERKRAEELRSQLASIVEFSNDAIISMTLRGRIVTWNPAAEMLYGYSAKEAIGSPISILVPPVRTDAMMGIVQRIKSGERITHFQTEHVNKEGSQIEVSLTLSPISDAAGKIASIAVIARDIRERQRAERELQQAKDAAEAANRAKSQFLANMSHELRTPLNGIIGMTDLALDTPLAPEQRDYLGTVQTAADHLLGLVSDILDFSKIEAGKLNLDQVGFNLKDTLRDVLKPLGLRAEKKGLGLACQIHPDIPNWLVGDPVRLRQVLINLVGNGIKFTEQGEVAVQVELAAQTDQETRLHFAVRDTGNGIPADKQGLIFDPFVQADGSTTRKYGGTGLGLAITTKLVEMMGGRIWVESEVGRGSIFHFTVCLTRPEGPEGLLPAPGGGEDSDRDPEESRPRQGTASRGRASRPLRILLVEDDLVNQQVAVGFLKKHGHTVVVTGNGRQGLVALFPGAQAEDTGPPGPGLPDGSFDLVLMDLQMPEMDGLEAIAAIRAQEKATGGHVPIIALTAHARKDDQERCLAAGFDSYLTKPIRAQELFQAIASLVSPVSCSASETSETGERRGVSATCSESPGGPSGDGVFDKGAVLHRLGGRTQLLHNLVKVFLKECPTYLDEIRAAIATGDARQLERAAHTLKGSVSYFGSKAAFAAADKLESQGHGGDLAGASQAFPVLEEAIDQLQPALAHLVRETVSASGDN